MTWRALDASARRALVLVCYMGTCSSTSSSGSSGNIPDPCQGPGSPAATADADLSGSVAALSVLSRVGAMWADLPTRPRNRLALSLALHSDAVTGRLQREVASALRSGMIGAGATALDRDRDRDREIVDLLSQYMALLLCLVRMQCRLRMVPQQLRQSLRRGLHCLDTLAAAAAAEGEGEAENKMRLWQGKARDLLLRMED